MKCSCLTERTLAAFLALSLLVSAFGGAFFGCGGGADSLGRLTPDTSAQKGAVHYISDHLGNANLLTDPQGNVLREESRYPYGLDWRVDGDTALADYVYTGKEYDEETGLVYFGGRYYSPEMGRWLTPDPLFLEKPETIVKRPLSSNIYAYVRNNPMTFVDDDGLIEKSAFEMDQRIGTYSETTLAANTRIESIFQKTIGWGLVVMAAAPVIALAGSTAPILSEAAFTLSLTAYSTQSSLSQIAVEETGIMWSAAKTAAYTAANFALTHPEETMAFGKGLFAGLTDAGVKVPEIKFDDFVVSQLGEFVGEDIHEQLDNVFSESGHEK